VKNLVIRAIELLELAQLGSALTISVSAGRFQQRAIFSERMERICEEGRAKCEARKKEVGHKGEERNGGLNELGTGNSSGFFFIGPPRRLCKAPVWYRYQSCERLDAPPPPRGLHLPLFFLSASRSTHDLVRVEKCCGR